MYCRRCGGKLFHTPSLQHWNCIVLYANICLSPLHESSLWYDTARHEVHTIIDNFAPSAKFLQNTRLCVYSSVAAVSNSGRPDESLAGALDAGRHRGPWRNSVPGVISTISPVLSSVPIHPVQSTSLQSISVASPTGVSPAHRSHQVRMGTLKMRDMKMREMKINLI